MDGTVSTCWSCMSRGVPHQRCSARQVIHELDAHQMRQTQYICIVVLCSSWNDVSFCRTNPSVLSFSIVIRPIRSFDH